MNISSKQAGEMPAAVPRNSTYVGGNCPISPGQQQKDQNRPSSFNKKMVRYKECLKNHAAAIGGNATDGCGEFMPSGEEGTLEGLNCSACNCHRNFHRKETESSSNDQFYHMQYSPLLNNIGGRNQVILGSSHHKELLGYPAGTLIRAAPAPQQNTIMSYKSTTGSLPNSESDEQDHGGGLGGVVMGRPAVKKRFRTKFTQEQKEKMLRFAEKAEWRIQKVEESVVQQFCQELGIKRRVLKVWMHNNKHNLAEKNSSSAC